MLDFPCEENNDEFTITEFEIGNHVKKITGDYLFFGYVVAKFYKRVDTSHTDLNGPLRYVVQNQDGILHIFAPHQLRPL